MRVLYVAAVPVSLLIVVGACEYYNANLLQIAGTESDGGQPPSLCAHATPPGKPTIVDAGGDLDLVFATRKIDFGLELDGGTRPIGYDLDKTCTCQGEKYSCQRPAWQDAGDHCDFAEGRDNETGKLLSEFAKYGMDANGWNEELEQGKTGLIVRIRGYNGQPNDDQVELGWYMMEDFKLVHGKDALPKWDGTDEFPIKDISVGLSSGADGGSVPDLDSPVSYDKNAYVSDGVLVGLLPKGEVHVDVNVRMVFTAAFLTARVVKEGSSWALREGAVAGAWHLPDIFHYLAFLPTYPLTLCLDSGVYPMIKRSICDKVDIYHDRGSPTSECDSLSVALGFEAFPVKLGKVIPPQEQENHCNPTNDPYNDTCP